MCLMCVMSLVFNSACAMVIPPKKEEPKTRIYLNKPLLVLLGFSLFWSLCMFLAPLTMPPHTVEHLATGTAAMDFSDKWATLPFFDRVIYAIGDSQCHQLESRTYYINGNQMPVCSRCMALFLFTNLGVVTAMFVRPKYDISKSAVQLFPSKIRRYIEIHNAEFSVWCLLATLCILTTAIDGFYQLLTPYESTNLKRIIFSLPTGWFGGFAVGLMLNNIYYNIYDPDLVGPYQPPHRATPVTSPEKAEKARPGPEAVPSETAPVRKVGKGHPEKARTEKLPERG